MKTVDSDMLTMAVAQALETMAFIAVEPPLDGAEEAACVHVALAFAGAVSGQLVLSAPPALGCAIAGNLTVCEPESIAPQAALDALRELANVTAGLLLREACSQAEMPKLAIPSMCDSAGDSGACRTVLSANGLPVEVSLRMDA